MLLEVGLGQGTPQPSLRVLWLLLESSGQALKAPGAGVSSAMPIGPTHKPPPPSGLLARVLPSAPRRQWLPRGPIPVAARLIMASQV